MAWGVPALLEEYLTDPGQGLTFGIAHVQTSCDVVAKDLVLRREILATQ